MSELTSISGFVEHVIYRNPENGYAVMEVSTRVNVRSLVKPMINRKIRHCYLNEAIREETEDVKQENAKEEKK